MAWCPQAAEQLTRIDNGAHRNPGYGATLDRLAADDGWRMQWFAESGEPTYEIALNESWNARYKRSSFASWPILCPRLSSDG